MKAVVVSTVLRPEHGDQLAIVSIRDDKDVEVAVHTVAFPLGPPDDVIDSYLAREIERYEKDPAPALGATIVGKTFDAAK